MIRMGKSICHKWVKVADNKGADQTVHMRGLIHTFVDASYHKEFYCQLKLE